MEPIGSIQGLASGIDFRELYGGFVLAVRRVGGTIREKISRTPKLPSGTPVDFELESGTK